MTKKIFLLFALLLSFQWVAAQSVSDEQVIKIVMTERERGSDEKTIAQKLLRQGVTPAQLRRIKAKYDQEQAPDRQKHPDANRFQHHFRSRQIRTARTYRNTAKKPKKPMPKRYSTPINTSRKMSIISPRIILKFFCTPENCPMVRPSL